MKNFKGTPGPWKIYHHKQNRDAGLKCVGKENGIVMLEAGGCFEPHFTVSTGSRSHDRINSNIFGSWIGRHVCDLTYPPSGYSEQKANAILIAAAPELLETLQAMYSYFGDLTGLAGGKEVVIRAKKVIEKATL